MRVLSAAGSCILDADCPSGRWCRKVTSSGAGRKECAPFVAQGGACGGGATPNFMKRCAPGLQCADQNPDSYGCQMFSLTRGCTCAPSSPQDPCASSPCRHGGACASGAYDASTGLRGVSCSCTAGFIGERCESPFVTTTLQPIGQLSCSECVAAGKYYAAGVCAEDTAHWTNPAALGVATCSTIHGLVQGQECCDAYAGGRTGGSMHIHISGGSTSDISAGASFGGCDLTELSMQCADVDATSGTFCGSACRAMTMAMTDDCSREGLSITHDVLAANPICPHM